MYLGTLLVEKKRTRVYIFDSGLRGTNSLVFLKMINTRKNFANYLILHLLQLVFSNYFMIKVALFCINIVIINYSL